jgi:hypothetical protein
MVLLLIFLVIFVLIRQLGFLGLVIGIIVMLVYAFQFIYSLIISVPSNVYVGALFILIVMFLHNILSNALSIVQFRLRK